ncbi:MAG: universal stress protein [Woeseiaceae bacterium]|nr:universal stress protein [Woeseiaceae bacterium]
MRKFRNILLVIEPGIDNHDAIERAFDLATSNEAELSLISVVEEAPVLIHAAPNLLESLAAERTEELQTIAAQWAGSASIHVPVGRPFLEIIRHVLRNDLDLVIKAKAAAHSRFRTLGSTDMHVLRKCPCPVWIVRSEGAKPNPRILAAVDVGSEETEATELARRILEIATSLAHSENSELDVLHAWSLAYEDTLRSSRSGMPQAAVDQLLADEERLHTERLEALIGEVSAAAESATGVTLSPPHVRIEKGDADDLIPEVVKEAGVDLVIMGTVGRTGVPGFFIGNTAEEVLGQIDCSVLAIKPPGFESPVTLS